MQRYFYIIFYLFYFFIPRDENESHHVQRSASLELSYSKEVDSYIINFLDEKHQIYPDANWYLTYRQSCINGDVYNVLYINSFRDDPNESVFDSDGNINNIEKYIISYSNKYFEWNGKKIPVVYVADFRYNNHISETGLKAGYPIMHSFHSIYFDGYGEIEYINGY